MILLHFRVYKGKKTPLLRKHSICSDPQRCCFIFYSLVTIMCSIILPQEDTSPLSTYFNEILLQLSLQSSKIQVFADRFFMTSSKHLRTGLFFPHRGFSVLLSSRCAKAVLPQLKLIQYSQEELKLKTLAVLLGSLCPLQSSDCTVTLSCFS